MKSSSLLLPLALLVVVVLSSEVVKGESQDAVGVNYFSAPRRILFGASEAPRKVIGLLWDPINEADPQVVEAGKFAVSNHNRQSGDQLVFVRVVRAETQAAGGINYRLAVETMDGSRVRNCEAIVLQKDGETSMELTSFKCFDKLL